MEFSPPKSRLCVIELVCDNYLILRCTHKNFPFPYNEAFVDRIGNFDYTNVIADIIIKMIEKNAQGLFNIGTEKKSMVLNLVGV